MADVFLSYAREDRARAEQVAQGLAAVGVDVFWDNEIPPGQTWADYIEQKLTQCKALIVLWSEESTKSQWVREEARMGRDKGIMIPVMIDASTPPFGFGEVQAANLAGWNGEADNPNWARFVDAVKRVISAPAPAPQMPPPPPRMAVQPVAQSVTAPASPEAKKKLPMWVWIGGAAAVVVAMLAVIVAIVPDEPQVAHNQAQPAVQQPQPRVQPVPQGSGADQAQAIILQQLQHAQAAAAQQGFQMVGQPVSGGLQQGQSWNIPGELYAGYDYRVLGVCDQDCNDMDLVLFDGNGAVIAQDTTTSSQPMLAVQTPYNGAFTIQVQMYHCAVAPCYYAVALYARPLQ